MKKHRDNCPATSKKNTDSVVSNREITVPKLAHELRTRLGIIRGAIDNVIDGICGPVTPDQTRQLQLAIESTDRMSGLVEDLMESFSDRGTSMRLQIAPVSICTVVANAVDNMHSSAFKEGVKLSFESDSDDMEIPCDTAKIEQVLINLLRNAIKFTSRGGSITVSVRDAEDTVSITVADTGVGIPEEKLQTIFKQTDDIQNLKDPKGGYRTSGLGLIIVKEIIDAHHGTITVTSKIGKGSTFTFTLNKEQPHGDN